MVSLSSITVIFYGLSYYVNIDKVFFFNKCWSYNVWESFVLGNKSGSLIYNNIKSAYIGHDKKDGALSS